MPVPAVSSVLRSNQALFGLICERATLDFGIAFYSDRFAGLAEANQFREVVIERVADVPRAIHEADVFFTGKGLTCARWAPAEGARIAGLAEQLAALGYREHVDRVMTFHRLTAPPAHPRVRVLPARAMRAAFDATFATADGDPRAELQRAAYDTALDHASMDMFVAMVGGRPAGRCGLFEVGDIGRILGPVTLEGFEAAGTGEALLAHVLTLAQRLSLRMICTQMPAEDAAIQARFRGQGFELDGEIVEYHRTELKEGL